MAKETEDERKIREALDKEAKRQENPDDTRDKGDTPLDNIRRRTGG